MLSPDTPRSADSRQTTTGRRAAGSARGSSPCGALRLASPLPVLIYPCDLLCRRGPGALLRSAGAVTVYCFRRRLPCSRVRSPAAMSRPAIAETLRSSDSASSATCSYRAGSSMTDSRIRPPGRCAAASTCAMPATLADPSGGVNRSATTENPAQPAHFFCGKRQTAGVSDAERGAGPRTVCRAQVAP